MSRVQIPSPTLKSASSAWNAFVAQLDRATDFESVGRRFESCRTQNDAISGPLAQLVEQQTLNLRVAGSIPARLIYQESNCFYWIFCGNSSVVERDLAKVDVAGPTPVSRFKTLENLPFFRVFPFKESP